MIIAMVPMRSGSKGIPDKNIKEFRGKPLFTWNVGVLLECLDAGIIDRVVINTDSERYKDKITTEFLSAPWEVFYRSERTARDNAVNIDVAQEFIEKMDMEEDDILLYVQVTSPYLTVGDVKKCIHGLELYDTRGIEVLNEHSIYPVYNSAMTVGNDYKGFRIIDGVPQCGAGRTPRQKMKPRERMKTNGCIYSCTTAGAIRETASLWKEPIYMHEQPYGFELDEPADWVYGEEIMK